MAAVMLHARIAIFALIGMVIGNFAFALMNGRDWSTAIDRSYFQAVAVAVVMLLFWVWEP
jgi:hypothetical protein